jgi:hypothetical protein
MSGLSGNLQNVGTSQLQSDTNITPEHTLERSLINVTMALLGGLVEQVRQQILTSQ